MTAPLEIVVTNAGRAAIVNAENTGTDPLTITQIGLSSTAVVPAPTAVALAGEFKRVASIAGEVVAADTIHVTLNDYSSDAYSLRSIGLYLADGTLFAVYGQAGPVLEKTAQSIAALAVDVIFADISAASLTFGDATFSNPPATTERQGVVELATVAEAQTGIDALRALTPAAAKAAILGWLLTQDGSGSALDADLLDGEHGSYYTNIVARLGYTPWGPSNDGSGSGLDADLLDGQDSAFFTNIPARLGFVPVQQGTGVGQLSNTVKIGWSGSRLKVTVDATDQGGVVFDAHIADVWRSSNDGAGSGLDADLLDGQQGSYYTNIVARLGYTPLNVTAYTAADVLAKLLTVDGSGSGLDADMVDGWNRDSIRDWNNLLNKPFNWSGQPGQPGWVWGSNDGSTYYVWNPSNFSVNYANSAGKLSTSAGSAPDYAARAAVTFNGQGTVAVLGSKNVSSVTDNGVGLFTVNFATALPDANYACGGMACQPTSQEAIISIYSAATKLATSCRHNTTGGGGSNIDFPINSIIYL